MKTAIVIPWREQPSRVLAFEKLVDLFRERFPSFEIIISDSTEERFNLSQARNLGAKKAIELGADIIIFNDADLFASPRSIASAVEVSRQKQEIVAPYNIYCQHNTAEETKIFFTRMKYALRLGRLDFSPRMHRDGLPVRLYPCSGCIVVPAKVFSELGGFEEKIKGWGPEDTFFHRAYFEKYGKMFTYLEGTAHSTFNDPSYRGDLLENQKYKDLVDFKDKRN